MVRKKFSADSLSDHMVLLRAFQFWQKARFEGWEQSFCKKNYISAAAFDIVTTVRTQLLGQLRASGFVKARGSGDIRDLNANSENWAAVKAALVAGMYDNLARVDPESGNLITANLSTMIPRENHDRVSSIIRPSPLSVLSMNLSDSSPVNLRQLPSNWLVYDEMISQCPMSNPKTKKCKNMGIEEMRLVNCVTVVSPLTTALLAGPVRTPVICMPLEGSESHHQNYELLKNKVSHQNQPLTMADIDQVLRNFSTEVPRLETLNVYHPEENPMKIQDSSRVDQRRSVILRLDGSAGILSYECKNGILCSSDDLGTLQNRFSNKMR
ncbi:unnamed protein product [Rodentolepis nana]|uniref:DEP domain-containing protein n=1 Tax=Rodentolepis nana TaxID=102285 RepID=A0A0R3TG57_RODNA|nr:unnamed protein product [Rodentolepis nana]